jgi:haloalkane dehalogenase
VHYVDEGAGPIVLLVHGEPDWSYMYRHTIARLVREGYRCIAADHVGFGRSDKVRADGWYVIERHVEVLRHVIEALDLRDTTLVVHDWGGPIGLRQAVDMPERFSPHRDPQHLAASRRLRLRRRHPPLAPVRHPLRARQRGPAVR